MLVLCDTVLFIWLLLLLLYLTLFHYDTGLLWGLLLLLRFYWPNYILLVHTHITSARFNRVRRICCTFGRVNHINSFTLRFLLIICSSGVRNHDGSSLFWSTFVTFTLLWELWLALLLLNHVSRFGVIFSGSRALLAKNLSWGVDCYILVRVFVAWINSLDLRLKF